MNTAVNAIPQSGSTAWHAMATDELLRRPDTNVLSGLDGAEVPRRLEIYGSNKLPEGRKQETFMRFLMQLNNILVGSCVVIVQGVVSCQVDRFSYADLLGDNICLVWLERYLNSDGLKCPHYGDAERWLFRPHQHSPAFLYRACDGC
jgi:magnesium-transporting ATPase (P-type)